MSKKWMPREEWDALVRGDNCPLCAVVAKKDSPIEFAYYIADLTIGRLILMKNQYVKGYCALICFKHVREPYELTQDEQQQFFTDMMRAGKILENVFKADKMNFQILGNSVPHLHCHLEPRYLGDAFPHKPIDPNAETVILKLEEYQKRIAEIRKALNAL